MTNQIMCGGVVTRDQIAATIHHAHCGCANGPNSRQGSRPAPAHYPGYVQAADAVLALLRYYQVKADNAAVLDDFAQDVLRRCRMAMQHHGGRANPAWSTGEKLAVALVLRDTVTLDDMGYTAQEAAERVTGGMCFPPADMTAWLTAIRTRLGRPA